MPMNAQSTVKFKLDVEAELSAEQKDRLAALAAMPDTEIDYRDIPKIEGRAQHWTRPEALVPNENKQQVTLRLDADVLQYFKGTGKRYQSRINAALREYMRAHQA